MLTVTVYYKHSPDVYVYDGDKLVYEKLNVQSYILKNIIAEIIGDKAYIKKEHLKFFIELMESPSRGYLSGKHTKEMRINSLRMGFIDIIRKQF